MGWIVVDVDVVVVGVPCLLFKSTTQMCLQEVSSTAVVERPETRQSAVARGSGVTKKMAELLAPRAVLPPRVNLSAVQVLAVGKVHVEGKGNGKGKGSIDAKGKGKGKTKGKPTTGKSLHKVVIYVREVDTGTIVALTWQAEEISTKNLEHALVNVNNAKPVMGRDGFSLELDGYSDIKALLNPSDAPLQVGSDIKLWTSKEAELEEIGSHVNIVFFVEGVQPKQTANGGDDYVQLNVVDTASERVSLQVFDHTDADFAQGSTIIAFGMVIRPGRIKVAGIWHDDTTWGQAKYSAWRTAFHDVGVLVYYAPLFLFLWLTLKLVLCWWNDVLTYKHQRRATIPRSWHCFHEWRSRLFSVHCRCRMVCFSVRIRKATVFLSSVARRLAGVCL